MVAKKNEEQVTDVDAVKQIYSALKPFDADMRQRVLNSVTSLLGIQSSAPSKQESRSPSSERPISLRELLLEKQAVTNTQKIVLFAYYREKVEGKARFSRDDLKDYFSKAHEVPPRNYNRDFADTEKLGLIHEDGADSYLTSRGLEIAEAGFGGRQMPRGRNVGNGNKRSKLTQA